MTAAELVAAVARAMADEAERNIPNADLVAVDTWKSLALRAILATLDYVKTVIPDFASAREIDALRKEIEQG